MFYFFVLKYTQVELARLQTLEHLWPRLLA